MKDWIKIIIIIIVIMVLLILGYFLVSKFLLNDKKSPPEKKTVNVIKDKYELGDDIIFKKIENVMFKNEDDKRDFSKWKVLYQEDDYIILYSVAEWDEVDIRLYYNELIEHRNIMTQYKLFTGYYEDFRLLGKYELELFGCNTYNMTCLNVPDWIGTSLTSVTNSRGKPIVFSNNKINVVEEDGKYLYHPVIKVSKSIID